MRLLHVPASRRLPIATLAFLAMTSTWGIRPADGAPVVRPLVTVDTGQSDGEGEARVVVRRRGKTFDGVLIVTVRRLAPSTPYEVVVDGVRIGTLFTNG